MRSYSLELSLGSIFLHNSVFHEKTYNYKNVGRKSLLLTIEQFFSKFEIMQWKASSMKKAF